MCYSRVSVRLLSLVCSCLLRLYCCCCVVPAYVLVPLSSRAEERSWLQVPQQLNHIHLSSPCLAALVVCLLAYLRSLPDSTRDELAELLLQAERAPLGEEAALLARVKERALRALEGRLLRPIQVG